MKNITNRIQDYFFVGLFAIAVAALIVMVRGDEPPVAVPKIDPIVKPMPEPVPPPAMAYNVAQNTYNLATADIDGVMLASMVLGTKEPTMQARIVFIGILACIPMPVDWTADPTITGKLKERKLKVLDTLGNLHDGYKVTPVGAGCFKGDGVNRESVGIYIGLKYLLDNSEGFEMVIVVGDKSEAIKVHPVQIKSLVQGIQLAMIMGTPKKPKGLSI